MSPSLVFACLDADTLGGIQQVTHTLAQGLAERGYDVHVIGLHRATDPFAYVARPRYRHHVINRGPMGSENRLTRKLADRRLRAIFDSIGPGYAVLTSPGVVTRLAGLLPERISPIGQYHGSYEHARGSWHLGSIRRHYGGLDQAVFLSDDDAWLFSEHALLPNTWSLPNPLACWPDTISSLAKPRVLGVGRLEGVKRFDRLITAFARSGVPGWELHLIGDGVELERLRAHAYREGIKGQVVFRGRVPSAEMAAEYLDASVVGLSSEHEGLPLVLAEAAAHGVPSVAFDVSGGVRSIAGALVPPGDVNGFAGALAELMRSHEERRRVGAAARSRVEALRLDSVLDRWESLFAHLRR
ncbi:glycosyltransferase [Nonomuraea sp. NPDC046570]|uniref:glycosyltransferase n=1 Tax=Nonomuraea sp. NPDC046570 TaxID=3155255 RepID=UPI0033ED8956